MNPVLILARNCLELTKRCVESVRAQDIETDIFVYDNGSTDGTVEWGKLSSLDWTHGHRGTLREFWQVDKNEGVSRGWNILLTHLFNIDRVNRVLVLNNDVVLPSEFYSSLISYDVPFISGVSVDTMSAIQYPSRWENPAPCPDFSAFLIRRDCWNTVGPFDEKMVHYAGDCDYHVRAHRAGIKLLNSGVPFYHERSSTLKNADPKDRVKISNQANADRQAFREKWGCIPGEPAYAELFK